jgi:hypothetical protein
MRALGTGPLIVVAILAIMAVAVVATAIGSFVLGFIH